MRQYSRQLNLKLGNQDENIEIDNLRVTFQIVKTQSSEPNASTIVIYNLNRESQEKIISKTFNKAILSVGYEDVRVIYAGDIIEAHSEYDGVDTKMVLSCGDGFVDYSQGFMAVTLKSGATDEVVVNSVCSSFENTEKGEIEVPNPRVLPRGKVLLGSSREILDKVIRNNKAQWSIQDGQLIMLPENKVLGDHEGFILSESTGMIGFPEKSDSGLSVKCLLNPALKIGGLIRIESILPEFSGDYKIVELSHYGDLKGNDWFSQIVCIGGKFQKIESNH